MQSRKSIPNVGRRAQGRKTLFMLKGNGVSYPSSGDPADTGPRTKRYSRKQGSLTLGGEGLGGGGELGDPPVTYDESVLNQPSHPYNRIIQRILMRHQAAERKELHRTARTETDLVNQVLAANSAPPHVRSNRVHSPALSHTVVSPPSRKAHPHEDDVLRSDMTPEEAESCSSHLQWADILRAEHCSGQGEALDVQSCTLSSPEDRSVFSLDLAKGYLTDRGLISDRSQDGRDVQGGLMDTTRSEPNGLYSLPRLTRKKDLQPLDEVLDYFWVYQGMSRQLLDRHSPDYLWNKELFQKKPVKLPPLCVSTRQKATPTSPECASSVQFSRGSSEDAEDTPGETPREEDTVREKMCELKSRPNSGSPSSENRFQSNEVQTPAADSDVSEGNGSDDDDSINQSCQNESPEEKCEKEPGRRVILVVKMPVLTHETSSSDLLDND